MQDQWLWVAVSIAEVLLVLVLLLLVSWIRARAARSRDRRAIRKLVAATREGKDERLAEINAFVAAAFGLSGDALTKAARAIYRAEARLIQIFANTYLERNAGAAANFGRPVRESTDPYWELAPGGKSGGSEEPVAAEAEESPAEDAAEAEEAAVSNEAEVARLRGENTRLSEELKVTMDTMSRMLNEYSTVFAKEGDIGNITVQDEELPETASEDEPATAAGEGDTPPMAEPGIQEPEGASESGEAPAAKPDVAAGSLDIDPDDILAAAQGAAPPSSEASATPEVAPADAVEQVVDPDAVLADARQPDTEALDTDLSEDSRFAAEMDSEMKDLSVDEDTEQTPDDETARQEAERQKVIDAES